MKFQIVYELNTSYLIGKRILRKKDLKHNIFDRLQRAYNCMSPFKEYEDAEVGSIGFLKENRFGMPECDLPILRKCVVVTDKDLSKIDEADIHFCPACGSRIHYIDSSFDLTDDYYKCESCGKAFTINISEEEA